MKRNKLAGVKNERKKKNEFKRKNDDPPGAAGEQSSDRRVVREIWSSSQRDI